MFLNNALKMFSRVLSMFEAKKNVTTQILLNLAFSYRVTYFDLHIELAITQWTQNLLYLL